MLIFEFFDAFLVFEVMNEFIKVSRVFGLKNEFPRQKTPLLIFQPTRWLEFGVKYTTHRFSLKKKIKLQP
jgi:hypothetical protein